MKLLSNKKYNELYNLIEAQRNMRLKDETAHQLAIQEYDFKLQEISNMLRDLYALKNVTMKKTKFFQKIKDIIMLVEKSN